MRLRIIFAICISAAVILAVMPFRKWHDGEILDVVKGISPSRESENRAINKFRNIRSPIADTLGKSSKPFEMMPCAPDRFDCNEMEFLAMLDLYAAAKSDGERRCALEALDAIGGDEKIHWLWKFATSDEAERRGLAQIGIRLCFSEEFRRNSFGMNFMESELDDGASVVVPENAECFDDAWYSDNDDAANEHGNADIPLQPVRENIVIADESNIECDDGLGIEEVNEDKLYNESQEAAIVNLVGVGLTDIDASVRRQAYATADTFDDGTRTTLYGAAFSTGDAVIQEEILPRMEYMDTQSQTFFCFSALDDAASDAVKAEINERIYEMTGRRFNSSDEAFRWQVRENEL